MRTPDALHDLRTPDRTARSSGRDLTQLDHYLGALDVHLTPQQFARLSEVSAVPLEVPHEAITGSLSGIQGGDTSRLIAPAAPVR
ncbi:hypothetical protein [Streptomyces sp. NPDC021012]|uniref:hypothetical protein n=1 Tax=unclassified Streptomyces TaxID=2593676 RepID=UPI0037909635